MRKARCDLGDVNAPSSPPCSRCRREQRNLVALDTPLRRAQGRLDASFGVSTHQMVVEYEGEKARTEGTKTHVRCSRLYPTQQGGHAGPSGEGVSLASIQREKEPWPTPDIPVNAIPQIRRGGTALEHQVWPAR
jgi:hypothetical protein